MNSEKYIGLDRTNEIRAVARIATRIVVSSIMDCYRFPQNIRPELGAVNLLRSIDDSGSGVRCYTVPIRRGGAA